MSRGSGQSAAFERLFMDQHASAFEEVRERPPRPGAGSKPVRTGRRHLRSILVGAGAIALLTAAGLYGQYWWTTGRFLVSTDDAYLQADNVIISPKVTGYIASVLVADNQPVHAGQVLARIDDRDYHAALAAAQADVDAQAARSDDLTQQIAEQQLLVTEARATVEADRAALTFANQDYARYATLARSGAETAQAAQQAASNLQQKQAALDHDTAAVAATAKQIDVLHTQLAEARAILAQKQAGLRQAELNLEYTTITSPVDGTVTARSLRVGQYVQAGTQLMAVVPLQAVYVTANYKETQLTDVHPGQPVTLEVDTFPGVAVRGVVNSVAPASGQEFALLPPDNATGNFTKIVQRVPVKITIDPHDPLLGQLRPGMSVEPTIDTRPKA
jgi:membrane fusion protein, multidrug efflux system